MGQYSSKTQTVTCVSPAYMDGLNCTCAAPQTSVDGKSFCGASTTWNPTTQECIAVEDPTTQSTYHTDRATTSNSNLISSTTNAADVQSVSMPTMPEFPSSYHYLRL